MKKQRCRLTDRHRRDGGDDVGWGGLGGQGGLGAIDHDLRQVVQQFLGTVLRGGELEELGVLIDEVRVHHAGQELVILQHVQQERNVGLKKNNTTIAP